MRGCVVWVGLVLAACRFDGSAPKGVIITCESTAECPRDWHCSPMRGICLLRDDTDTVAPLLTSTVTPPLVRPGDTVVVNVMSNEPLLGPAVVEVRSGTNLVAVPRSTDALFLFPVPGDQADGLLLFYGRAEDLVGNGTQGVVLGSSVVDGTAPTVISSRITPTATYPGAPFTVTVTLSEDVRSGARLQALTAAGTTLAEAATLAPGGALRFELTVPAGTADGPVTLSLDHLVDLVGNPGDAATLGSLDVDGTPPAVEPLGVTGQRFSRVSGFNDVAVHIGVAGAVRVDACLGASCVDAADAGTVHFTVGAADTEGTKTVAIRARDAVGNLTEVFEPVTFDFSAPVLLSATERFVPASDCPLLAVSALSGSGSVVLQLTSDEALAEVPWLDAGALAVTPSQGTAPGQSFAFVAVAPSALTAGPIAVQASLVDDVGNRAARDLPAVAVDVAAPPALDPAQQEGFVYSRSPFGTTASGFAPNFTATATAGTFEPGAYVQLWSSSDLMTGLLVATLFASDAGALPMTTLPPVDYEKLYFRAYDSACNAYPSATTVAAVPRVEWVATMGTKVVGQAAPNPHRFVEEYAVRNAGNFVLDVAREWGPELARTNDDAGATSATPSLRWQKLRPDVPAPACLVRDYYASGGTGWLLIGDRYARTTTAGWEDLGQVPAPVYGGCGQANDGTSSGGATVPFVMTSTGWLTLPNGATNWFSAARSVGGPGFVMSNSTYNMLVYNQSGYVAVDWFPPGDLSAAVPSGVSMGSNLSGVPLARQNVALLSGTPIIVGDSGGTSVSVWHLQGGPPPAMMNWVQLADAPAPPIALSTFSYGYLLLIAADGRAWTMDHQGGTWVPVSQYPLAAPPLAWSIDPNTYATVVATDFSMASFDGNNWSIVRPSSPVPGAWHSAGYSAARGTLVPDLGPRRLLFHTALADGGAPATWTMTNAGWSAGPGPSQPTPTAVAANEADGGIVMSGGQLSTFTQQYRNGAWQTPVSGGVQPRYGHAMAADPRGLVISIGGIGTNGAPQTYANQWNGSGWAGSTPLPGTVRAFHAMAYDPVRRFTVLFGGTADGGTLGTNDTWQWSGQAWANTNASPAPSPRLSPALTWDYDRGQLWLHGGSGQTDTWTFDGQWVDRTRFVGQPSGPGRVAWDPVNRAVASISDLGESFLLPDAQVFQRFVITRPTVTGMAIQSGRAAATVRATTPTEIFWWVPKPFFTRDHDAMTPLQLSAGDVANVRTHGLRLGARDTSNNRFTTDYVELTIRYVVTN